MNCRSSSSPSCRRSFSDQVRVDPYLGVYYFYINLNKKPWNDAGLRRAISMAIDREFIADKVWAGAHFPAYGMVPPGITGYPSYKPDSSGLDQIEREERGRAMLRDLGYGPEIR